MTVALMTAIGAQAQKPALKFKTPLLLQAKAAADEAVATRTMRDSIVARDGEEIQWKTTYTYNQFGYVTSKLTRLADGTYDESEDKSYYVDYEFDAQNRPLRRSKFLCNANGERSSEVECVEAQYDQDGYSYYEKEYGWTLDGQRYVAEEVGLDQWNNPVYGVSRKYIYDDFYEVGDIVVTRLMRQQFTGRAYVEKEGDEHVLKNRCLYSINYQLNYESPVNPMYYVWGTKRETAFDGDYYRATYYQLEMPGYVTLDTDLTNYWMEYRQYEWHLNAAHTRPLTLRCKDVEPVNQAATGPRKVNWICRYDSSVDFTWDDKERLTQIGILDEDDDDSYDTMIRFTYADDKANSVALEKILYYEDSDSWEDGGLDDYEGEFIYNWFGRMATYHYSESDSPEYDQSIVFDEWDTAGRITHCYWQEDNLGGETLSYETWLTYRDDGKISTEISVEYNGPKKYYEKTVFTYDDWGLMCDWQHYRADSPEGPWTEVSDQDWSRQRRNVIRRVWNYQYYKEGNWSVEEEIDTDEDGNYLWGHKAKFWTGRPYHYTLDTYEDLRGALDLSDRAEAVYIDEEYTPVVFFWDSEQQKWVLERKPWYTQVYAHRTLDDGRIANELYEWDETAEDMVLKGIYQYITVDEQDRVVRVDSRPIPDDDPMMHVIEDYTYFGDTHYLETYTNYDRVVTYYYSDRLWYNPEMLDIGRPSTLNPQLSTVYDLQGRPVNVNVKKGLYIRDGRKVVVR